MTNPLPSNSTPPDLVALEAALDRLARAEAAAMPPGLTEAIVAATASPEIVVRDPVIARLPFGARSGWRVAASFVVLIAGATLAGWLATRSPLTHRGPSIALVEDDLVGSVWSAVDDAWSDDAWTRSADALAEVKALRASMDAIGQDAWSASDLIDADWLSDSL